MYAADGSSRFAIALCMAILFVSGPSTAVVAQPPSAIFTGGRILTVDPKFSVVSAMAVSQGRILATGSDAEILRLAGPQTQRVELMGRTVLPGLIDSHVHAAGAAVFEFDHTVPTMQSVAEVLEYIRGRTAHVKAGEWIVVNQVFITRLDDQRFPTRAELDEVAPNHPVCFRTGPDASLNSAALLKAGIDRDYQVPEGITAKVERAVGGGEPTGIVRNFTKIIKIDDPARQPNSQEREAALIKMLADYNSVGITGIAERSVSPESLKLFEKLYQDDKLTCRVFLNWGVEPNAAWPDVEKQVMAAVQHPLHAYNEKLWLRGVKVFLDGGMLTGSAYMREPWGLSRIYSIDDPNYRGLKYIEPERLYQLAKLCLENELQFTAHSVGDGAVHALIDAYAQIDQEFRVRPSRPCITHCNFMSREAIDKMAALGIVADLQPAWLWLDGATLEKQFGNERMAYFQPYQSLTESGVIVGGGSDHMQKVGSLRSINPYNPFLGMSIALKRIPRGRSEVLRPEQLITREQALRLYTLNNAYILLDEKNRGSLEPGKLADFIIIDRDYMTCSPDELAETKVIATYLGGQQVYGK